MSSAENTNKLVSFAEAAALTGLHVSALYQAVTAGKLEAVEIVGRKALRLADLREYQARENRRRPGKPCSERERGLLGVAEKYVSTYHFAEFPPPNVPVIYSQGVHMPPPEVRREGIVGITEEALEDTLERFQADPARQERERTKLLARAGFDTSRPYEVVANFLRGVYFFRYTEE